MNIRRHITHPTETFRTAPVWVAATAIGAGLVAGGILLNMLTPDGGPEDNTESQAEIVANFMLIHGGEIALVGTAKSIFLLRRREQIERSLESNGYSDRLVEPTLKTWCLAQATLVACEQYDPDAAIEYLSFIEDNKDWTPYSNLRHC